MRWWLAATLTALLVAGCGSDQGRNLGTIPPPPQGQLPPELSNQLRACIDRASKLPPARRYAAVSRCIELSGKAAGRRGSRSLGAQDPRYLGCLSKAVTRSDPVRKSAAIQRCGRRLLRAR